MGKLSGKTAIITGAGAPSGIGATAARLFHAEGANLMLVDVDETPLAALAAELGAGHMAADVADDTANQAIVAATMERFGSVDAALLNAGIVGKISPTVEYDLDLFDRVLAINVRGVFLGLKHVMPAMKATGGSIVITSSTAGIRALPGLAAYTASKHAVIGLMRTAALEGAADNIRVNTVNPSPIATPMMEAMEDMNGVAADRRNADALADGTPLKRYGKPEEVARMMLFLASEDSSFSTGGVYMVDGGVSAGRV
jgi:NAD(P)-dependent dehydrogenase (short-subunit alcohol dehydrogenase family)